MQAYGVVTVLDPALDLPVPHDDCLHGLNVRDALTGLASQRKFFKAFDKGSFLYGTLLFCSA